MDMHFSQPRTVHFSYLKGFLNENIVYPILILLNYNYEMSKEGVLGFSISYLVLEIFKFLTYLNWLGYDVIVSHSLK